MSDLFSQFLASSGWGNRGKSRSLFDDFLEDMNALSSTTEEERRKRELASMTREERMRALMTDSGLEGGLDAMPTNYGAWSAGQEPAKFSEAIDDLVLPPKESNLFDANIAAIRASAGGMMKAGIEAQENLARKSGLFSEETLSGLRDKAGLWGEFVKDYEAAQQESMGRDPNLLEKGAASLGQMAGAVVPGVGVLQATEAAYREARDRDMDVGSAFLKAAPEGAIVGVLEKLGIDKVLGKSSTLLAGALKGGLAEGVTEGGQELVSIVSEALSGKKFQKGEIKQRLLEAPAIGAIMGAPFGGVAHGAESLLPKPPVAPQAPPQAPTSAGLPSIDLTEGQVPYVPVDENPFLPGPQGTQAFLPAHLQMPAANEAGTPFGRFHEVEVPPLDLKPMDKLLNPFSNKGHALPSEALTEQLPVGMPKSKDTLLFEHMADRIAQHVPVPRKKPATEVAIDDDAKTQVGTEAHIAAAQEASKAANGILRHLQNEYMRLQHEYDSHVIEAEMSGQTPKSESSWMEERLADQDDVVKAFYSGNGLLPSVLTTPQALADPATSQGVVDTSIRLLQQLPDSRIEELKQLSGTAIDRSKLKTLPKMGIVARNMAVPDTMRVTKIPDIAAGGDITILTKSDQPSVMLDAQSVASLSSKEWAEGRNLIHRLQDSQDVSSNDVLALLALSEKANVAAHVDAIEPVLNRHGYTLGSNPEEIRTSLSSFRNLLEGVPSSAGFYLQLRNTGVPQDKAKAQALVADSIAKTIAAKRGVSVAKVWGDKRFLGAITSETIVPAIRTSNNEVATWHGVKTSQTASPTVSLYTDQQQIGFGDTPGSVASFKGSPATGVHEMMHAFDAALPEILSRSDYDKLINYMARLQAAEMAGKPPDQVAKSQVDQLARSIKQKGFPLQTSLQSELIPGIFEYMAANGIVPDGADKRAWFKLQQEYSKFGYTGPDGKEHYSRGYKFLPRKVDPEIVDIFKKIFASGDYKAGKNEFDVGRFADTYESTTDVDGIASGIDRSALPIREITEKDVLGVEPMEEAPAPPEVAAQSQQALPQIPSMPPSATPQGPGNQSQKGPSSAQEGHSESTIERVHVGGFSGASVGSPESQVPLTQDQIIELAKQGADPRAAEQRDPTLAQKAYARLHAIFFGKERGALAALRYKDPAVRKVVGELWKHKEIAEGQRDAIVMGAQAKRNAYAVAVKQYGEQQKAQGLPFGRDESAAIKREVFKARLANDSTLIQDPGIRQAAVDMWNFIDDQQRVLMTQPGMTPERIQTIQDSLGSYMHREYAAFHDKDWMKLAPKSEFFWKAVDRRAEQLIADGSDVPTAYNEAQAKLLEHLWKTQFDATGLVSDPNSTGRMDMDAWKTRLGPQGLGFFHKLDKQREADASAARQAQKAGNPAPPVKDDVEVFYEWVESERAKAIDRWNHGKDTKGKPMPAAVVLPYDRMLKNFQEYRQDYPNLTDKQIVQKALDEEDHPEIWRQLMGEITDPEQAAVITATTLAHDIAFGDMFNKILDEGMKTGVLTDRYSDVNRVQITGPGYGPMTKFGHQPLYATEEFAEFLNLASQKSGELSKFTAAMGLMKFGLVFDAPPFVRNVYGMIPMYVLSGHPLSDFRKLVTGSMSGSGGSGRSAALLALKATGATINAPKSAQKRLLGINTDSDAADLLIEAMKRGVVEPGAVKELTNVLEHYAKDSGLQYDVTGKKNPLKDALLTVKNGASMASRLYQSPDVFIKLLAWQKEIEDLAYVDGVGSGKGTAVVTITDRIKDQAAENVKNKFQSYGRLPKLVREFSKSPLLANFVTFPAEMSRNMYHAAVQTVEMARVAKRAAESGDVEKAKRAGIIAAKRGTGLLMASGMFTTMSHAFRYMLGMDEEEKESFSNLAMFPSSRNAPPLIIEKDGTKFSYVDSSAQDPYTMFSKISSILMSGNMDWEAKGLEVGKEIVRTYGSLGIPLMSAGEAAFGINLPDNLMDIGDTKRQYKTYINDYQPKVLPGVLPDSVGGRLYRLYRNMGPSFLKNNAEAFARANELGLESKVGAKEYKMSDWLLNNAGVRVITTDIGDVLRLKGIDFTSDRSKLSQRVNNALEKLGPRAPFSQRKEVVKSFEDDWKKIYVQYATYVSDARKLGMSDKEIRSLLTQGYDEKTKKRGPNLPDDIVNAMLRGKYVQYAQIKKPEVNK